MYGTAAQDFAQGVVLTAHPHHATILPSTKKETTMAHENRSAYIHMRISKSVKELIREQAKKEGMTISEYVEDACMRCIEADREEEKR